uniref:Protein FAR1-RELATED SEQUENCE n=1 Tax=Lactuca sativa TaxID=4236 RepID=A0A9R1VSC9_LACSA|nr:hypothetical protein LSAT_V11C400172780 [Lactuca sativa]
MNKYDMVFVPFTGIDNHKKCVTFGAGLLSKEYGFSYERLLRAFLKAFRKQPKLLEPHDFENVWHMMLEEFKIIDNNWMKTMYGLRRFWILAFFKDIPMSGLMRTTSLSESQNWSFQTTTLIDSYLIMFMMTFDSVMERQRHNQILNDFNTATTFPKFITRSPNEPNASKVQKEISRSKDNCFQKNVNSPNDDCPNHDRPNRAEHFNKLLGVVVPDVVPDDSDIQNPSDICNKGSDSHVKRLKSRKEMLEKESSKPKRKCATCEQMVHLDKRNCPLKNKHPIKT